MQSLTVYFFFFLRCPFRRDTRIVLPADTLKIFTTVVFDNKLLLNSVSASLFRSSPYFFTKEQQRLACPKTSTFDKFPTRGIVVISYPQYVRGTRDTYDKIASKESFSMHVISVIKIAIHKRREK